MSKQSTTIRIHVSNVSEDVWDFIQTMSDEKKKTFEIAENAELCDRDVFSLAAEDNAILVLPKHLDEKFFSYFKSLFPKKNFQIFVPEHHSGELCLDILKDKKLFSKLKNEIEKYTSVSLTSYSSSRQFYELSARIREFATVSTPEAPDPDKSWTVNFFGSKTGIRQLADHGATPDFPTVQGYSMSSVELASQMAAYMYRTEGSTVVKTNKGHAGAGVLIFRPGDLSNKTCEEQIRKKLLEDKYWSEFPILVEQYVECDPKVGGGFPNAEVRVINGKVEFLYYCGMRVTKEGMFKGVEIGIGAMSKKATEKVVEAGYAIGKGLAKYGYAGYFDVDCLADKKGKIFVSESNVRRTGGTHVYATVRAIFGKNFMEKSYSFCNNSYELKRNKKWSFDSLHEALRPILFDRTNNEGVIITAVNPLYRNVFGFIIIGKTKARAYAVEEKMEALLGN